MTFIRNLRYKIAGLFLLFKVQSEANAQLIAGNFEPEINYYRQVDAQQKLPQQPILFIGSSSIKNWVKMDSAFAGYPILNRGFGGSTLNDVVAYANDVVLKYDPKQIVIYCGENDFSAGKDISAEMVFDRFVKLYTITRNKYSDIPIVYISIKPSPSKLHIMTELAHFNNLICEFASTQNNFIFADVYSKMLTENGTPDTTLFLSDQLHMNRNGYAVWNEVVRPLLVE